MLGRYRESVRTWSDPVGRALFRLRLRPNHLTMCGLLVSASAGAAFVFGHVRLAGVLLILAGLFDLFDGSLARASGQATTFGAFLDSVIDRYSDIVVMLGIVVLYARMPHARGALLAMAGLAGSVMVSYTKARAESIGVTCNIGVMERPERLICLIAGALLGLMEPALWVLAILANLTALQRIVFTRRLLLERAALRLALTAPVLLMAATASAAAPTTAPPPSADTEQAWASAVAAYQQGDPAPLAREFATEAALTSPIRDYARYLLSDALARRGDLAGARAAALALVDRDPDSRLASRALLRAATLSSSAGDEPGAHAALKRLLERYPDSPEVPEALYLVGQTAEARQQTDVATAAYRQLRVLAPTTAYAEAAGDRLTTLMQGGVPLPPISMSERIDRAERLLKGGVPKTAGDEAEAIATEARDAGIVLRALRVVADAAARLKRYDAAARALELAANRAPAEQRSRLRLEQARMLIRAGQSGKAQPILTQISTTGTESEVADALAVHAGALEDTGRDAEAAAIYRQIAARFPNREAAGAAMWRLGWLAWLRNDIVAAGEHWARLADAPGGRAFRVAALYWRARTVEQGRDRAAAEPIYLKVLTEAPRSYYGMLAARRVARSPETPQRRGPAVVLPAKPEDAVAADPGFARVDLLRRIGLVEYAWEELEDVVQASVGDHARLYGASAAYVREERYHLALRIARRHFEALAVSGDPALPRAFWEIIYPFGWRNEVIDAAQRSGLDPYLVAAVVREESSYYPRAVSRAGARGLMQLMPATARPMADLRGLAFEGGSLLDDPRANIDMGTAFLAGLLKEFGDPRLALAAYNAGPKRARDWWKARRTSDMEAWVEQIPYSETLRYVKRVTLSWEEYRRIYASE